MSWDSAPVVQRGSAPAARKEAWETAPVAAPTPKARKTSQTLGFMEGLARPFEQASKVNPFDMLLTSDARDTREAARKGMHDYFAKREQTEKPGLIGKVAGNVVGTLPVAFATRSPLLAGGVQGALTSEHDDLGGIAMDAGLGAVLNKATGAVVDKVADAIAPAVAPAVQKLKDAGVKLTPGQIKGGKALLAEDKAMSRPIVGDRIAADRQAFTDSFNRGAVNRVAFQIGKRLPDDIQTGHDATAWLQEQVSNAYSSVLPKLTLKPDNRLATGIQRGWQATAPLTDAQRDAFKQFLSDRLVFGANGQMSGRALTIAARDIRDTARRFMQSASESERAYGAALNEVSEGLKGSLRAQNPQFAKELRAADAAYRDLQVVNRASAAADEGVATTGQYKTASRAADRTKGKRSSAAGTAPMQDYVTAGRAVSGKTPNSGTAERLMDGKWIPTARGAVDAGLYEADKALTALRLLPRSPQAKQLAGLLAKYRDPLSIVGGPVVGGLLAGLAHD